MLAKLLKTLLVAALAVLLLAGLSSPVAAQETCGELYAVERGDTLRRIANLCGTTVEALLEANPSIENRNIIYVGQILNIPQQQQPGDGEPDGDDTELYIVRQGDTLSAIARRFNTTVAALLQANPTIEDPNIIYVGQPIVIPGADQDDEEVSPELEIAPESGPPGTEVQLVATGFPPNEPVEVGFGRPDSEYDVIATATTNAEGVLRTIIQVPSFAQADRSWVFVVNSTQNPSIDATSDIFSVTQAGAQPPVFTNVDVYLVSTGTGQVGCGDELVAVQRSVPPTQAPLTAAIRELLSIEEQMVGQAGLYNALYQSDLQLEDVTLENRLATIRLSGDLNIGGVCDEPRIVEQLRRTAEQYETVDYSRFFINGQPLDQLIRPR